MANSSPTSSADSHSSPLLALGYAAFLAISWTWCIGMFLPGLLVEQFGKWGWVVFALPNIVGAGAMGWVLTQKSSTRFVSENRLACIFFSLVTIAFHLFWAGWFLYALGGSTALIILAVLLLVVGLLTRQQTKIDLLITALMLVISSGILFATRWNHLPRLFEKADFSSASEAFFTNHLTHMVPVCVLGFLLCPYLDLTFHRVCQETQTAARRIAFTVGFGLFFFIMISFSLEYAIVQRVFLLPSDQQHAANLQKIILLWRPYLMVHMLGQVAITVALHMQAVRKAISDQQQLAAQGVPSWDAYFLKSPWQIMILLTMGIPLIARLGILRVAPGMSSGEVSYRMFMGFYGLVFPAYVWIIALPQWRRVGNRAAARLDCIVCLATIIIAMPMFWLGFIAKELTWLLPGVGVVLLVGLWRLWSGATGTKTTENTAV